MIETMSKLRNVTKKLIQAKGREPSIEEVAEAAEVSVEEAKRVMKISKHPISLDRPIGESDDSYFGDFIEDESTESPVFAASREMLRDRIDNVLSTLTFREREIIKLRYGIGDGYTYTLEEVGRIFRVTRERVRQIEAKAVRKLQHPVRARKLSGFLDANAGVDSPTTAPPAGRAGACGREGGVRGIRFFPAAGIAHTCLGARLPGPLPLILWAPPAPPDLAPRRPEASRSPEGRPAGGPPATGSRQHPPRGGAAPGAARLAPPGRGPGPRREGRR
jgi:hypothetical protein